MINIVGRKKLFLGIAGLLVAAAIASMLVWGFDLGIDFTGGSLLEVSYETPRPSPEAVREALRTESIGEVVVQPAGDRGMLLKFGAVDELTHQRVMVALRATGEVREERFESIGPVIGSELKRKSIIAMSVVAVLIVLFIAWAFRKVSRPISSWKYGLVAIGTLAHDVIIPSGIVAAIGHFYPFEIDIFFITALLTILGFSVQDTIVIFDRIRENLGRGKLEEFDQIANRSVNEVLARSLSTTCTILLVLAAVYFLGGETTKNLALVLFLGVFFGSYSSIFVASPLLSLWAGQKRKRA
jgi:preprotein translocase subunit SecF